MSRIYTVEFENVSISAAQDLFEIIPAANKPIRILAYEIAQISDVGDAAEEMLRIQLRRVPATATGGSGGTAPTPRPTDSNDAAAGFTAEVNNTTVATSTATILNVHSSAFNIRVGYLHVPIPEIKARFQNGELAVLRLLAAPADAVTLTGTIWVEEL